MKHLLIVFAILAIVIVPTSVAGDLEDLKAANESGIAAWNAHDVEAIMGGFHEASVGFWPDSAFPVDFSKVDKAEYAKGLEIFFDDHERWSWTPYGLDYRVIGDTGIICGQGTVSRKPKGAVAETQNLRVIMTFVKSGGKWLQTAWHMSPIPAGS